MSIVCLKPGCLLCYCYVVQLGVLQGILLLLFCIVLAEHRLLIMGWNFINLLLLWKSAMFVEQGPLTNISKKTISEEEKIAVEHIR